MGNRLCATKRELDSKASSEQKVELAGVGGCMLNTSSARTRAVGQYGCKTGLWEQRVNVGAAHTTCQRSRHEREHAAPQHSTVPMLKQPQNSGSPVRFPWKCAAADHA